MTLAKQNDIKIVGNKAYKFSIMQARFFPIKMNEALKMIADGTAQYYKPV